MNIETKGSKLAIGFIIAAVASRLVPHLPNFTAMESITLFTGAYLGWKALAALLPILTWYASDLLINNTVSRVWYPEVEGIVWFTNDMLWVYISAIIIIFIGAKALKKWNPSKLAISAVSASLLFFVVTNFGTWMSGTMYPMNGAGLLSCFTAALPFLKSSLMSNLAFTAVLFGGYELVHYYAYESRAQLA